MAIDTKASALRAVWHHWQHTPDAEMKVVSAQLAARGGSTAEEIAEAAGASIEDVDSLLGLSIRK